MLCANGYTKDARGWPVYLIYFLVEYNRKCEQTHVKYTKLCNSIEENQFYIVQHVDCAQRRKWISREDAEVWHFIKRNIT